MYRGALTDDDVQFLDALGKPWRLVNNGIPFGQVPIQFGDALFIDGIVLPERFSPSIANMMVVVPAHYPATPLDMFYLDRSVGRVDGRPLVAIIAIAIGGAWWWRWSRHRDGRLWKPGVDGVATHYQLIENTLMADAA